MSISKEKKSTTSNAENRTVAEQVGKGDMENGTAQDPTKNASRDVTSASTSTSSRRFCPVSRAGQRFLCALFLVTIIVVVILAVGWKIRQEQDSDQAESSSGGAFVLTTAPPTVNAVETSGTLHEIYKRGVLRCGVNEEVGRAIRNPDTGQLEGFSVDLCRTVSAAIFGADNVSLDLISVESSNRFEVLQSGRVDLLSSWDTYTMQRDLFEPTTGAGLTFSVPYFYDGMAFAGLPAAVECALSKNATQCNNLAFCTVEGTTYVPLLQNMFPGAMISTSLDFKGVYRNFDSGSCSVLVGDLFALAEGVVRAHGYNGEYIVGDSVLSHEPLSLVTRDGDTQWSDFVNWIIESMFTSEEEGFTQVTSLNSFAKTDLFGPEFREMYVSALTTSGNYGEMYDRNFKNLVPRGDINKMNTAATGLIYYYPFGEMAGMGPDIPVGGTIHQILERGHLRCGVVFTEIFGLKNTETNEWRGFDIDFCRALSAALFDGVATNIEFVETTALDRFMALQNGTVDVLSRVTTVTYSRDVKEKTSQKGLTFARPNFYDGLGFGGIPPYHECADNLDVLSAECKNLKMCVQPGTTFFTIVAKLFPTRILVPVILQEELPGGLRTGTCNVVAGGASDIAKSNIVNFGNYTGPYATGTRRFSKDPLTLVTREDDPQWSSFVFWTVMAVFFAEEQGLSSDTDFFMPLTNLFGPRFPRFFQNIIRAVGSYADIYNRNVESEISRGSTNLLNTFPYGPQHFAEPGLV